MKYEVFFSKTFFPPRKCKDLENFLEEKARQVAESLKTNMSFKQTFSYAHA